MKGLSLRWVFLMDVMISINLDDIAILNINGVNYRCIISRINKNETLNLLRNADLTEKSGTL